MFKPNQTVWCLVYGQGVVTEIRHEGTYPVEAVFNCDDERPGHYADYTSDGKYYVGGNVTLFPHPVEVIKATVKPSIDWSHVSEDFQYLAMDADGTFHIYTDKPLQGNRQWTTNLPCTPAIHFASFVPGTCDWKDSLVERPD